MQILTPEGYRAATDCQIGQAVVAIDPVTGEHLTNHVEAVEIVGRPRRAPWQGLRFGKHKEKWAQDWDRWTARRDDFAWVRVNGEHLLFAEQSVWANDNVTHAKLLKVGDVLYDAADVPIIVREVVLDVDGPDEWVRFKISGDHSYVGDDVTLHNASRFWVGGTANWDASTTTNWSASSGGLGGASVPTSSDDVSFDALANTTAYTVTVTATANCANMTWALPAVSGVPTLAGSSSLNIFGSLTNVATMLWTYSGTVTFSATASGKTITSASVSYACAINFNGVGGGWTLQDALSTSTQTINHSVGTLDTNGKTVTALAFQGGSTARTLTITNSTINVVNDHGTVWSSGTNLTLNATGSILNLSGGAAGNSITPSFGSLTYGAVNLTGAGLYTTSGSPTCATFSYTSTTNKTDQLILGGNLTVTGTCTIAGNSSVNRAFVLSSVLGTQRTISAGTIVGTNVDFQDISGTGAATWAYNSGSNSSWGDALGNTGLTCNPSVSQTYAGGTNNWSTLAAWTSRVPLPQDDVVVNTTTAGTLTPDMPRLGRNIDLTGFTRTIANSTVGTQTIFGNINFGSTFSALWGTSTNFAGRGAQTITSNGKATAFNFALQAFGGSYTLQDAFNSNSSMTMQAGTFDSQGFAVSLATIASTTTAVREIKGTSASVWSLAATSGTIFSVGSSTITTSFFATIKLTGNVSTSVTFAGAGLTYANLWWSNTAATGTLIITGANTFNDFKINRTTARTITFPAATTTTIASWTDESLGTAILTVNSSSAASAATLSKPGGDVRTDYCSIKDSAATGGANWRAGPHSTDVSGNTGWIFGNVNYANSGSLAAAAALVGSAVKNAKPSASLVCATIQAGNIRHNEAATAALTVGESIAGSKTGAVTAAGTLTAGARLAGTLVRSQSGSGALAASAAIAGSARENRRASASLAASGAISGAAAKNLKASTSLTSGASVAGRFGPGAIAASATLSAGAGLGGTQVSSYSKAGELDVGAAIGGRSIFQAESMTVEVLPSGATVEVLPSSATVAQRQRARS